MSAGLDLLRLGKHVWEQGLRALDVYSGIGGWTAGLRCANIEVVEAYEIWPAALETYNANLGTSHSIKDVRALDLSQLPEHIQLVVGSPPCTEFSLSNRGGAGDISEGLKDVVRFFEIVEAIRPRYWVMENVPRTAGMIREGLRTEGHPLHRFRSLQPEIKIVDFADFGLPQSRSRCLVGVFPFDILESYKGATPRRTLGQVLSALAAYSTVIDPVWGFPLQRAALTEMEPEPALNGEQLRMNREAKRFHPVYNDMAFPDRLDQPSRTVTATCTRVSRESIVVTDGPDSQVRRLTVRERASLQGFPIAYQFFGKSHSQKVKLVGNAVPPLFSYLIGIASQHRPASKAIELPDALSALPIPARIPPVTPPHAVGTTYPAKRRFRAALPGLRFKSGMRFQLANEHHGDEVRWRVEFFFGPSKDVQCVELDDALSYRLRQVPGLSTLARNCTQLVQIERFIKGRSPKNLQEAWRQSAPGAGPYYLVDALGQAGLALMSKISFLPQDLVVESVLRSCGSDNSLLHSRSKLTRNANAILAGLLLGSWFNGIVWGTSQPTASQAANSLSARKANA